jgi:hypothetical protein
MTTLLGIPRRQHCAARQSRVKRAVAGAILGWALAVAPSFTAELPLSWVELGADGALELRALVAAGAPCPSAAVDGAAAAMTPSAGADPNFPVRVCQARAPYDAKSLLVNGRPLPPLPAAIRRIVVFGDTGCRLAGKLVQDCDDAAAWPFATVARLAAAQRPDLVIHVGDYYYREAPCPEGHACAGSPYGDAWPSWQADFFDPAAPLLAAAPWVTVRGNHELCRRGGTGWLLLLDPHPAPPGCTEFSEPYALHLGGLELLVFDSANADDPEAKPEKVGIYTAQLTGLLAAAPPHAWLVTHRPVWAFLPGPGGVGGFNFNATLQAAIRSHVPPALDLVLSGHVHAFESFSFGPERPAQLIAGTGGDLSTPLFAPVPEGTEIDGLSVRAAFGLSRYGYLVLDRTAEGWAGTLHGTDDGILARCRLAGRELTCGEGG